jgi:hypothetical protein
MYSPSLSDSAQALLAAPSQTWIHPTRKNIHLCERRYCGTVLALLIMQCIASAFGIVEVDNALLGLDAPLRSIENVGSPVLEQARFEKMQAWKRVSDRFDESMLLVAIACGKETADSFESLGKFANSLAGRLVKKDAAAYTASGKDLAAKLLAARIAIRTPLGV